MSVSQLELSSLCFEGGGREHHLQKDLESWQWAITFYPLVPTSQSLFYGAVL